MLERKRKPRVELGLSRKFNSEKIVAENLLGDFTIEGSKSIKIIEQIFHYPFSEIKKDHLLYIAKIISSQRNKVFPRNYSRRKILIVKWLDENFDDFILLAPYFVLTYN